jgi:DNA-binding response OmpR family regulator
MRYKLLLIEDEPGLCLTLTDRLQNEGYDIDVCSDGEAGFNQAASQGYDLIILERSRKQFPGGRPPSKER